MTNIGGQSGFSAGGGGCSPGYSALDNNIGNNHISDTYQDRFSERNQQLSPMHEINITTKSGYDSQISSGHLWQRRFGVGGGGNELGKTFTQMDAATSTNNAGLNVMA